MEVSIVLNSTRKGSRRRTTAGPASSRPGQDMDSVVHRFPHGFRLPVEIIEEILAYCDLGTRRECVFLHSDLQRFCTKERFQARAFVSRDRLHTFTTHVDVSADRPPIKFYDPVPADQLRSMLRSVLFGPDCPVKSITALLDKPCCADVNSIALVEWAFAIYVNPRSMARHFSSNDWHLPTALARKTDLTITIIESWNTRALLPDAVDPEDKHVDSAFAMRVVRLIFIERPAERLKFDVFKRLSHLALPAISIDSFPPRRVFSQLPRLRALVYHCSPKEAGFMREWDILRMFACNDRRIHAYRTANEHSYNISPDFQTEWKEWETGVGFWERARRYTVRAVESFMEQVTIEDTAELQRLLSDLLSQPLEHGVTQKPVYSLVKTIHFGKDFTDVHLATILLDRLPNITCAAIYPPLLDIFDGRNIPQLIILSAFDANILTNHHLDCLTHFAIHGLSSNVSIPSLLALPNLTTLAFIDWMSGWFIRTPLHLVRDFDLCARAIEYRDRDTTVLVAPPLDQLARHLRPLASSHQVWTRAAEYTASRASSIRGRRISRLHWK